MTEIVGRHLLIRGVVQGVGFRWFMAQEAHRLGVGGWVRNLSDGRVEAVICGTEQDVAAMLHWATRGPRGARVDEVLVEESAVRQRVFERRATIQMIV